MINVTSIKNIARGAYGTSRLFLGKHAPTIATGAGIGCLIGSAVIASKKTCEGLDDIMTDHRYRMGKIDMISDTNNDEKGQKLLKDMDSSFSKKKIIISKIGEYAKTGLKLMKLYAPAIGLAALGTGLIFGAHNIMKRRNALISAAFFSLQEAYEDYRSRVENTVDEETLKKLYADVPELSASDDDEEAIKKDTVIMEETGWDTKLYKRVFDIRNENFSKTFAANMIFLSCCENALNAKLKYEGFVTLNDALKQLGMKPTNIGQIVGWRLSTNRKPTNGDGYIQFVSPALRALYNNGGTHSPVIPLEFNVDGPIYFEIDDCARRGSDSTVIEPA